VRSSSIFFYLNLNINIAQAAIKAPIDKMYTHNGSLPMGIIRRFPDFFAECFSTDNLPAPGGAE
jgi:hypothetical protein